MLEITARRQARGWSRAELARRARMTAGDIGKIEARRLVPYASQLAKIARALGVAAVDATRLVEDSPPQTVGSHPAAALWKKPPGRALDDHPVLHRETDAVEQARTETRKENT